MFLRSCLCFGLLFAGASCVPPAGAGPRADRFASASLHAPALAATAATEEPPPPQILAQAIAPGSAASPFNAETGTEADRSSALRCLTAAVYYEARSEPEGGQRSVAQVVLNRVRHPAFPRNVCGVVFQGSSRRTGCQFSFTCDGSLGRRIEPSAWARARRVAEEALDGYVHAPVGLATHFHTTAIRPWWSASMARAVTVGSHIFYRWHGQWGDPRSFRRPYVGREAMAAASRAEQPQQPAGKTEVVAGVTIHRGGGTATTFAAAEDGAIVRVHRMAASKAIRVHRGAAEAPAEAEPAEAAPEPVPSESDPVPVR